MHSVNGSRFFNINIMYSTFTPWHVVFDHTGAGAGYYMKMEITRSHGCHSDFIFHLFFYQK